MEERASAHGARFCRDGRRLLADISSGPPQLQEARAALARRDAGRALALIAQAEAEGGASLTLLLDKAVALRVAGDLAAALQALDQALALDPRNFLALLSKGALLERVGRGRAAGAVYRQAVAQAPQEVPEGLQAPLTQARRAAQAHCDAIAVDLQKATADIRAAYPGADLERFDESLEIFAGRARPFVQQPLLLHYPRLPAIPFYPRETLPWLTRLEDATATIAGELQGVREKALDRFVPYIDYPPGAPVDQWAELNHNPKWSTFFLWRDGVRQDEACALCPKTAALVEALPLADQPGFAPTVVFSVLAAQTRIPPHTGSTNVRLIGHLPLVLPGEARFRVGNVTRPWRMGEAWIFDDTIEHEAWNDAEEDRVILIFDTWNPFLSEAERALVNAMLTARRAFEARA